MFVQCSVIPHSTIASQLAFRAVSELAPHARACAKHVLPHTHRVHALSCVSATHRSKSAEPPVPAGGAPPVLVGVVPPLAIGDPPLLGAAPPGPTGAPPVDCTGAPPVAVCGVPPVGTLGMPPVGTLGMPPVVGAGAPPDATVLVPPEPFVAGALGSYGSESPDSGCGSAHAAATRDAAMRVQTARLETAIRIELSRPRCGWLAAFPGANVSSFAAQGQLWPYSSPRGLG
jgi:hypothetical protein